MTQPGGPPIWIDDSGSSDYVCLRSGGGEPFRMEFGLWRSDAIADLLRASLAIATGGCEARVSYDHEPAEQRLVLEQTLDSASWRWHFTVRVLEFDDASARQPDAAGRETFRMPCDPEEFCRAVLQSASRYCERHGAGEHIGLGPRTGFPLKALRALEAALDTAEPPPPATPEEEARTLPKTG